MTFIQEKLEKFSEKLLGGSDVYRVMYLLYITFGIWVVRKEYIDKNKYFYAFFRTFQVVAAILCLTCMISFAYDAYLRRHDIEKLSYNLGTSIFFVMGLTRFTSMSLRKEKLEETLNELNNNLYLDDVGKSHSDITILKKGEQQFKNITNVFYWFLILGVMAKILCHLITEKTLIVPLPYLDDLGSPYYESLFVFEVILFVFFVFICITQEMVSFGILIRISRHYKILSKNILELGKSFELPEGGTDKKHGMGIGGRWQQEKIFFLLRRNVIHHQELIKIMHKVSSLLREFIFVEVFGSGILLVDLLFHVSLQSSSSLLMIICQFIYLCSAFFIITTICYYGSEIETGPFNPVTAIKPEFHRILYLFIMNKRLIERRKDGWNFPVESHDAATALYSIHWLEMDVRNRRMLRLFQMALWKHPVMKAGKVFSVNLNMFIKFLNSIYSFLAFMQKTVKKD